MEVSTIPHLYVMDECLNDLTVVFEDDGIHGWFSMIDLKQNETLSMCKVFSRNNDVNGSKKRPFTTPTDKVFVDFKWSNDYNYACLMINGSIASVLCKNEEIGYGNIDKQNKHNNRLTKAIVNKVFN